MGMEHISIQEHKSSSYAPRTYQNAASAPLTIAFAVDFSTAGEKITKKAATSQGKHFLSFSLFDDPLECARNIYKWMKAYDIKTLNIAGNGIYTCTKHGLCQDDVNRFMLKVITLLHKHTGIEHLYSGGQTGIDLTAAICSNKLSIPCTLTLPKGMKMRFANGVDKFHTEQEVRDIIKHWSDKL